jgi:hypothetical protein
MSRPFALAMTKDKTRRLPRRISTRYQGIGVALHHHEAQPQNIPAFCCRRRRVTDPDLERTHSERSCARLSHPPGSYHCRLSCRHFVGHHRKACGATAVGATRAAIRRRKSHGRRHQCGRRFGAPKATPSAVVEKLNKEINATLADAQFKARLIELGGEPMPLSIADFNSFIESETEKWAKVVKFSGAKAE